MVFLVFHTLQQRSLKDSQRAAGGFKRGVPACRLAGFGPERKARGMEPVIGLGIAQGLIIIAHWRNRYHDGNLC